MWPNSGVMIAHSQLWMSIKGPGSLLVQEIECCSHPRPAVVPFVVERIEKKGGSLVIPDVAGTNTINVLCRDRRVDWAADRKHWDALIFSQGNVVRGDQSEAKPIRVCVCRVLLADRKWAGAGAMTMLTRSNLALDSIKCPLTLGVR